MAAAVRDGFVARIGEVEYEASPDGEHVRIYVSDPEDGFSEVRPGRHVRVLPLSDVDDLCYMRTTCIWREQPFIVLGEHDGWLRVEYTGGRAPVATELGLEEFDFGVYQGWAPKAEVTELREVRV
jgi:hypothetical protein